MEMESVKQLMLRGDFPQALGTLRRVLVERPDDTVALMLYGTCCRIMGDSDSFVRIYQQLAPEMNCYVKRGEKSERTCMWLKYAAMFTAVLMFGCSSYSTDSISPPSGGVIYTTVEAQTDGATHESAEVKDDEGLYSRVMKMSLKERFRYFIQRQDVVDELRQSERRMVVFPLGFDKDWRKPSGEHLLLIRLKDKGKTAAKDLKFLSETLQEWTNSPRTRSRRVRHGKPEIIEEWTYPPLSLFSSFKEIDAMDAMPGRHRKDDVASSFRVLRLDCEKSDHADGRLPRCSAFEVMDYDAIVSLKKAVKCIEGRGDVTDLVVSAVDPGFFVIGVAYVNVYGKMARTKYGGPRDYGDRFPLRVVTPDGATLYEWKPERRPPEPQAESFRPRSAYGGPKFSPGSDIDTDF